MTVHDYNWWPDGADERLVRQYTYATCAAPIDPPETIETTQLVSEADNTDLTSYGHV